jgi:hypothetical protein
MVYEYIYGSIASGIPEIEVYGNDVLIANGDDSPSAADYTSYGTTPSATPVTRTFRVENPGTGDLEIDAISVPSGFTLLTALPIVIQAEANSTFQVRFDAPVSALLQEGLVEIDSNAGMYSFAIHAAISYHERVLATTPLRYNRMNESSGTTLVDSGPNTYTGTYTGVAWGSGNPPQGGDAPFFDGTNDIANLHSAAFATAFNFNEGAMLLWVKVSASWSEGSNRFIARIRRDASNSIEILKSSAVNRITFNRIGGGAVKTINAEPVSDTGWFPVLLEWSVAGDFVKAYINGQQMGGTQTGLLSATGSGLIVTTTLYGAFNTSLTQPFHGYLSNAIIFDRAMDADIEALQYVPAA